MKPIKIGIMSQKDIRARTLAIASGQYKPKIDVSQKFGLHRFLHLRKVT